MFPLDQLQTQIVCDFSCWSELQNMLLIVFSLLDV